MRIAQLPGTWYYENAQTDCLCCIITAGRKPLYIGEGIYCEEHKRIASRDRNNAE